MFGNQETAVYLCEKVEKKGRQKVKKRWKKGKKRWNKSLKKVEKGKKRYKKGRKKVKKVISFFFYLCLPGLPFCFVFFVFFFTFLNFPRHIFFDLYLFWITFFPLFFK